MKLLLDTHIAVWIVEDNVALTAKARALLTQDDAEIYASAATIWEIAIKSALRAGRKDNFNFTAQQAHELFVESGLKMLDINAQHAAAISALPAIHADPFDRLMIAQAMCENMKFLTHDHVLAAYGEQIITL